MVMLPVTHEPGRHCASTGIRDIVASMGLDWTEAFCFGIGAGLGIWYIDTNGQSPTRMVHVRSADIEREFFTRIGVPFEWQRFEDSKEGEEALCKSLDQGMPTLLRTDIYYLPHFPSTTHFPGHVIVVWGYDSGRKVFFVTDTEHPGVLEVPFDDMRKARYCRGGFFDVMGDQFSVAGIDAPQDMPRIITEAVAANSSLLLDREWPFQGLAGLETWRREMAGDWASYDDWKWTARFAYQVIEKRGTGGGGFRLMYADFLDEASRFVPEIAQMGLAGMMRDLGMAWSGLAFALKKVSEMEQPDFGPAIEKLDLVIDIEAGYHRKAVLLK